MDMNQQAEKFLNAYAQGSEVPGGWGYNKALRNLELDYSIDSIARIDALLYRLSSTVSLEQVTDEQDKNNFFLLLAFYLGTFIAKRCDLPINWYSRHTLVAAQDLAKGFESQTICKIGDMLFAPMKLIHDLLFLDDEEQPSCWQTVDYYCQQSQKEVVLDEHQQYLNYMDSYFGNHEFNGGLLYRELLRQCFLDCSLDSLTRVDEMLQEIRTQSKPEYSELLNHPGGQNFLLFLAYYISTVIARAGEFSLHWMSYDDVKKKINDLPLEFESSRACSIEGHFYFPLAWLTEILFAEQSKNTCQDFAEKILMGLRQESKPIPIPPPENNVPLRMLMESNPLWIDTMKQAGTLAAHGMLMVSGGGQFAPSLLIPSSKGSFFRQIMAGTLDKSIEQGLTELEQNPNKLPYQALLYPSYVSLPSGYHDALFLSVHCYQGKSLQLTLALPFRHASQTGGFAILTPHLLSCSVSTEFYAELFQQFYQSAQEFKVDSFDFSWKRYFEC